jgi:hypothetical protein
VLFIKKKLFLRDPAEGTLIFRKTENWRVLLKVRLMSASRITKTCT